jgi:hypothetical protein
VEVDLRWENGKAAEAMLRPEFAGTYKLRAPAGQKIEGVAADEDVELRPEANGAVSVTLAAKRRYRVRFA